MPEDNIPDPGQIAETWKEVNKQIEKITATQKKLQNKHNIEPVPAESPVIHPAESTPEMQDSEGKIQKKTGASFPMPSQRPQAPAKVKEEGNVIVAKALAEQLGTAPELKAQMRIDERKMAVLQDGTLAALSHFSYRNVYDGVRYWGHITEWWLTGSQGLGGLARRHVLQALANTSGIQSVEKARAPNAIARNLWQRDWKKEAESEGKVVDE